MKTINANAMNRMDHPDVKDLAGVSEKQRRKYRIAIIQKFVSWSNKNKDIFQA